MLIRIDEATVPRNPRWERNLWHNEYSARQCLGCSACPERNQCGGVRVEVPIFDCFAFCCNDPDRCDNVCRLNPAFAERVREVGGFALAAIGRAAAINELDLPETLPMIFHGNCRSSMLTVPWAVLPLYKMFSRREGVPRFSSREELCATFRIARETRIILSGVDVDAPLERWWGIGEDRRRKIIRNLIDNGILLTTGPNYSLFTDVPRWTDLHAMKRIAITQHEFADEGLPCALHINGRTEHDFTRWSAYVKSRPEITHVAYEFTTGTAWAGRREQHISWLRMFAERVARPLSVIVRGGPELLSELSSSFKRVTLIETSSFVKTIKRRRAERSEGHLRWIEHPTEQGQPLDDLLDHNIRATHEVGTKNELTELELAGVAR